MTRFGMPSGVGTALAATVLVTSLALVGCGQVPKSPFSSDGSTTKPSAGSTDAGGGTPEPAPTKSSPPSDPLRIRASIADGKQDVPVDEVLKVAAAHGKLTAVKVTGKILERGESKKITIDGEINSAKTGWQAAERLEPTGDYKVTVTGTSDGGKRSRFTSKFSTEELLLEDQIFPDFAGTLGGTVGVGTPVVLRFDYPVKNKALFEKNLHVTNTADQDGSWHWYNDKEVHWRPKEYWEPGTKVNVTAELNSLPAGYGRYGQKNASTSFTVGDSVITKVNLKKHVAKVYVNGEKKRTIPISAGKPGSTTRSGIKIITEKRTNYTMTSEMIGLPKDGPESYSLTAAYAMRITNTGEFLHSAPWNAGYFGRQNASHGCTGMSVADSRWLYEHALPGSPVETTGSDRGLEPGNGLTDWNADFETYAEGSAL
jgi:lipoprotein-anchoring transpeptidase ErfK/SrfK